ncbi:MAG: YjbH domain-containing protein [Melioribacter sp.]|nr:YjbH domain-containing protein [Melioribacter sp.]
MIECIEQKLHRAAIFLIFLILPYSLDASSLDIQIINALKEKGFENIFVRVYSTKITVIFENRIYRYNVDALICVMQIISNYKDISMVQIFITENKLPYILLKYNNHDYNDYLNKKISLLTFKDRLEVSYCNVNEELEKNGEFNYTNNSTGKIDIVLLPIFRGQFGDFDNPVRAQLNIIPEISTSLWRGAQIIIQTIFPIYNEFPGEGNYVRPGIISLSQNIIFDRNCFISLSAGYFSDNRYGVDMTLRKIFFNGKLMFGMNTGYTGYLSSYDKKILYSELYLWTGNISFDYRINSYDLNLGLTLGKFLYGDKSIRVDINRQFGEVEIGFFYAQSTSGAKNGGFNFSVPIPPSNYSKSSIIRVRPVEYFRWEYKVRGEISSMIGVSYNTGNSFLWKLKKYNPNFLYKTIFINQ